MAITITNCCSKPPLPPFTSTTTHQITRLKNEKWRRQYMIGVASVIIGLGINDLSIESSNIGMAIEGYSTVVVESTITQQKWSDKRICPSWNLNSLETIVPENLPRPSARRRWESVGHGENSQARTPAPKIVIKVKRFNDCFTM